MRNLKKVLALVIAFSMMLSVVAFAGFNDVAEDADYAGAVELLSALDIIVGDDLGNFNPDKTISRAEMAAIICRIKGLEASANAAKGATKFDDVAADHWASGYVNVANQNGVIAGYGDGKFGPEDEVTYEAAVKMVVCALGFEPMAAQKGGWPTGYLVVANTYKISEGVSGSTRADVATLVYNALSTPMMDQTIYGADAEFEILDGKKDRDYRTLLTDMDIYIASGVVGAKDVDDITFYVMEDSEDFEFEEGDVKDFEINDTAIANYQFQNVDAYVRETKKNDYEVVAVVAGVYGETFKVLSDDVVSLEDGKLEYYVDSANSSKTKTIKVDVKQISQNRKLDDEATNADVEALIFEDGEAVTDIELVFIENTGDTTFDVLIATEYYSAVVDEVDADRDKIEIDGKMITFDFEDEEIDIILTDAEGNELTLADFAENDVVAVLSDASTIDNFKNFVEYIKIIKLSDAAVTGTVEETFESNGKDYVVIDGEDYENGTVETFKVGDEGIFYIGMTGKIVEFDGSSVGENYGYIVEAAVSESSFTADKWQVKVLTKNDGVVTYDVTDAMNDAFDAYLIAANGFDVQDDAALWEDATADEKANGARLITYKTNSKGQIRTFEKAEGTTAAIDGEYKADSQRLAGKSLEDDAVIFVVSEIEADDLYASDLSYLVDESAYEGFVLKNEDAEYAAVVITADDALFDLETGFAIVTKKATRDDEDGNEITAISYVQNEEEGSIVIDDDSQVLGGLDTEDITVGSVILFNADAEGIVSKYAVLATVANGKLVVNNDAVAYATDAEDEAELHYGYLLTRDKKSKGDVIDVVCGEDTENFTVKSAAYKYTYNDAGRNTVIEIGDYMAEDVYVAEESETEGKIEVSYVLIRTFEGEVVDIYSANKRVKVTGSLEEEPEA